LADLETHLAPAQVDVGVVALLFGHRPDAVREGEGLGKVVERVFLFQVVLVHHLPAAAEYVEQGSDLIPLERRHAAAAGDAVLLG
jgi:hypothetical protein